MHWIKHIVLVGAFLIPGCDVPTGEFDSSLDLVAAEEKDITPPALVFFPDKVSVNTGSSVNVQVFIMEVENLAGAHIQIIYNSTNLSLTSVEAGDFLEVSSPPIFFYEDDAVSGLLDIYMFHLGMDSKSVSGTGILAFLIFSTTVPGQSVIKYTTACELVDPDDNVIVINGFGEGMIDAR